MNHRDRHQRYLTVQVVTCHVLVFLVLVLFLVRLNAIYARYFDLFLWCDARPQFDASMSVSYFAMRWFLPSIPALLVLAWADSRICASLLRRDEMRWFLCWSLGVTVLLLACTTISAWATSEPARMVINWDAQMHGYRGTSPFPQVHAEQPNPAPDGVKSERRPSEGSASHTEPFEVRPGTRGKADPPAGADPARPGPAQP